MSATTFRLRPMLVREVAKVAGEPRETIRTRLKQGIFKFEDAKGWKRFTDFETIMVSVHARLKRATTDEKIAELGMLLSGKALMDEWIRDDSGVPYFAEDTFDAERFLIFWRDDQGELHSEILNSVPDTSTATNERFDQSYIAEPVFTLVNLRTLLRQTLTAMLEVQLSGVVKDEEGDQ